MNEKSKELINKFYSLYPNRKILLFVVAGSHFFDMATENSDIDFRGIYLPAPEEFYKGENRRKMIEWKTCDQKNKKNSPDDIDCNFFSITKFFELLATGDFNMMELLHAPDDKIVINSNYMKKLVNIRQSLLVNDISAFLGFIKKEYRRYGVNVYHYKSQKDFLQFLDNYDHSLRLNDIWSEIIDYAVSDPLISFTKTLTGHGVFVPSIKIAQRLFQSNHRIKYVYSIIKDILENYGHRQKSMATANVEYKGLYHAMRLIYEANDLYDYGEFRLPFKQSRFEILKNIKTGNINQVELFNLIETSIAKLYTREKETTTNRKQVVETIDRLQFHLDGVMKLDYLLNRNSIT